MIRDVYDWVFHYWPKPFDNFCGWFLSPCKECRRSWLKSSIHINTTLIIDYSNVIWSQQRITLERKLEQPLHFNQRIFIFTRMRMYRNLIVSQRNQSIKQCANLKTNNSKETQSYLTLLGPSTIRARCTSKTNGYKPLFRLEQNPIDFKCKLKIYFSKNRNNTHQCIKIVLFAFYLSLRILPMFNNIVLRLAEMDSFAHSWTTINSNVATTGQISDSNVFQYECGNNSPIIYQQSLMNHRRMRWTSTNFKTIECSHSIFLKSTHRTR